MTLSVKTDHNWPGGGFALLSGEGLDGVAAVTIENCLSKLLLDARGQWGKFPHPFPVDRRAAAGAGHRRSRADGTLHPAARLDGS